MEKGEFKRLQIASLAEAEAFGGTLFFVHIGLLLIGAFANLVMFFNPLLTVLGVVYCAVFALEKWAARWVHRRADVSKYPLVLGILTLRAVTFNVIVLVVWSTGGDVFQLAAFALLIAATINVMVFHATYPAIIACAVVPLWFGVSGIAVQIGMQAGWSLEGAAAAFTIIGVSPYFLLSLSKAQSRWQHQQKTQAALNQAQREDAMGKVAGGVSHDFNNILSVISGSLHFLEHENDPSERRKLIAMAQDAIDNGAVLTRQLLALGQRSTLLPRATDLAACLNDVAAFAQNVLPRNIRLTIVPLDADVSVFVDARMLQTALLNLALNAKHAMPSGGRLELRYGLASAQAVQNAGLRGSGRYAMVALRDTGIGMDQETLSKVFEPFFTSRGDDGGSGLGLPMVKGFAEQSKGGVSVISQPGQGTTVTLVLPVAEEAADQATPTIDAAPHTPANAEARILLVEDNRDLLRIIERRLQQDGMNVSACRNGDEARAVWQDQPDFDLVLSDFVMPGATQGPDLLQLVRSARRRVPFILMSGHADQDRRHPSQITETPDLFIQKPLNLDALSAEIVQRVAMPGARLSG